MSIKHSGLAWAVLLSCSPLLFAGDAAQTAPPPPASYQDPLLPIQNPEQIVKDFRAKYVAAHQPRLLIYINRDLVQPRGEMVEVADLQHSTQVKGDSVPVNSNSNTNIQVGNNNNPATGATTSNPIQTGLGGERTESSSLSVRVLPDSNKGVAPVTDLEARQIEETFGERLSEAGAHFIDQEIAATLLKPFAATGDRFLTPTADNPEKDQTEALKKSADIVIEILALHKTIVMPTPAGDATHDRLQVSVRAIDLRQPGVILAQVSTESLFGFNRRDGEIREEQTSPLTTQDFLDQVSLALMDRITF